MKALYKFLVVAVILVGCDKSNPKNFSYHHSLETFDTGCDCNGHVDDIAGEYAGFYMEKQFVGMIGNSAQFDLIVSIEDTINLERLIFNNVSDSSACIYLASDYFTDTIFIRDFIENPTFLNYDWNGEIYQNHGRDYWEQEVQKTGNSQKLEFYERDTYIDDNGQAIVYYPRHFVGHK